MNKNLMRDNMILIIFLLAFTMPTHAQTEPGTIEVSGIIVDAATGEAIENATIEVLSNKMSLILSNSSGKYLFYLPEQINNIKLKVTKSGYEPYLDIYEGRKSLGIDFMLKRIGRSQAVKISNIIIEPKLRISGKVEGLTDSQRSRYKVLVYVLTDKWYIHPFAENKDGKGFASIQPSGSWQIQTVFRENQSYKVAFLVVDRGFLPPSSISLTEGNPSGLDAEQMILSKINPHYYLIQNSPDGI